MEQIKEIVHQVIGNLALKNPDTHNKIYAIWKSVAGEKALRHTRVVGYREGNLIVHVDSSAWLFQMNLQKRKLSAQIKKEITDLKNICFRISTIT